MIELTNVNIDFNSMMPLYKQVAQILTEEIKNGHLQTGEKLPSELKLMEVFKVSRITVRTAIADMIDEGMLQRSQGKGTFVSAPKKPQAANDLTGLTESCHRAGKKLSTKPLSLTYSYPTKKESEYFHIPETVQIIESIRLRYIDGFPALIEKNHYLQDFDFLFHEDLSGSLFKVLKKHGIIVSNSSRTLEIAYATADEASLLDIKKNAPVLLFRDYQSDENKKPIFISQQLYNTQNMVFYL